MAKEYGWNKVKRQDERLVDVAKRQLVAGALGLHGLRAVDRFDNLANGQSRVES